MIAFAALAAAMVLAAIAWLVPPLLRRSVEAPVDERAQEGLAILRGHLAELDAEHRRGQLSDAEHAERRTELERRALEEAPLPSGAPGAPRAARPGRRSALEEAPLPSGAPGAPRAARPGRRSALLLALALPVLAALLYARLGDPDAMALGRALRSEAAEPGPVEIDRIASLLVRRLDKEPDNVGLWALLGQAYRRLGKAPEAVQAYRRVATLLPDDADAQVEYAEALTLASGRTITPEALALVRKALAIDPTQRKALAMAGSEAFERKDYASAIGYWQRLRDGLPAEAELTQQIGKAIDEARRRGGIDAPPLAKAPAATAPAGQVSGVVELDPLLRDSAAPDDAVFVFARAAQGPRMPLAIVKLRVRDLPAKFALDDSMSMSGEMKLSNFSVVVVGARVSKSGTAAPQRGDIEGTTPPVRVGSADLKVTLDRVLP